jgi:hypothetical protein
MSLPTRADLTAAWEKFNSADYATSKGYEVFNEQRKAYEHLEYERNIAIGEILGLVKKLSLPSSPISEN